MQRPPGRMPSSTLLSRLRSIMQGEMPATAHERCSYLLGMLRTTRPAEIYSTKCGPQQQPSCTACPVRQWAPSWSGGQNDGR